MANALRFIAAEITTGDVCEGVLFGFLYYNDNAFRFLKWRSVNSFLFVIFVVLFSRYPGYAKYRDLLSFNQARFLWYAESGIDVCYPSPRHASLYPEKLSFHTGDRLSILDTRRQLEESARIEHFMSVYEPRHLLTAQLNRHYSNMVEPYRSRHRANLYYEIQEETVKR